MFPCRYCGGLTFNLSFAHSRCKELNSNGILQIQNILDPESLFSSQAEIDSLIRSINEVAAKSYIRTSEKNKLIVERLGDALAYALNDHMITEHEETVLRKLLDGFSTEIPLKRFYDFIDEHLKKSVLLRNLQSGNWDNLEKIHTGSLPFLLQRNERALHTQSNVDYYELRTRTEYKGGSQGVSIRLTKGVYYRTGSFKGRPVKTEKLEYLGTGTLALTDKNIYYHSPTKSVKIAYSKIISLETFEDGITIMRDGASARPQTFKGVDGWFYSNAINIIANS